MSGDDVDQALLSVVRQGSRADRRAALPRLLKAGNPEALAARDRLRVEGLAQRALRGDAHARRRRHAEGVRRRCSTSRGKRTARRASRRSRCSRRAHPSDPAVGQLLSDSLFSGRREEAQYAAGVLGRIGTEDARQALVAALSGKDATLAAAAASALGQIGDDRLGEGSADVGGADRTRRSRCR